MEGAVSARLGRVLEGARGFVLMHGLGAGVAWWMEDIEGSVGSLDWI